MGAAGERSGGARPSAPLAPSQVTCSPAARAPLLALSLLVLSRTLVRSTRSSSPVGPWLPLPAAHRGTPSLLFLFETDDSFLARCKRGGKQVLLFNPHENTPPRRELLLVSRPRSQRPPGHLPYARHSPLPPPTSPSSPQGRGVVLTIMKVKAWRRHHRLPSLPGLPGRTLPSAANHLPPIKAQLCPLNSPRRCDLQGDGIFSPKT